MHHIIRGLNSVRIKCSGNPINLPCKNAQIQCFPMPQKSATSKFCRGGNHEMCDVVNISLSYPSRVTNLLKCGVQFVAFWVA